MRQCSISGLAVSLLLIAACGTSPPAHQQSTEASLNPAATAAPAPLAVDGYPPPKAGPYPLPTLAPPPYPPPPTETPTPVVAPCTFPIGRYDPAEPITDSLANFRLSSPQILSTTGTVHLTNEWIDSDHLIMTQRPANPNDPSPRQIVILDVARNEVAPLAGSAIHGLSRPIWLAMLRQIVYGMPTDLALPTTLMVIDPANPDQASAIADLALQPITASRAGDRLLGIIAQPEYTLVVFDAIAGQLIARPLTLGPVSPMSRFTTGHDLREVDIQLAPDGRLAVLSSPAGFFLVDIDHDTSCELSLGTFDGPDYFGPWRVSSAVWSQNGQQIFLSMYIKEYMGLGVPRRDAVLNLQTGELRDLRVGKKQRIAALVWAPDSRYAAAVAQMEVVGDGQYTRSQALFLVDMLTGESRLIAPDPLDTTLSDFVTVGWGLAWAPDGHTLVFECLDAWWDRQGWADTRICRITLEDLAAAPAIRPRPLAPHPGW